MDSRLVLSVIFVTLCWGSIGTFGQTTITPGNSTTQTNITASNNTTPTNVSTGNSTTPTAAPTTVAPPVSPNTTVVLLETPLTRAQCGKQQLCAAEPANCDPSTPGSCFFLAARQQSGQNFEFALAGQSGGYIAASVSSSTTQGPNDPIYVCANNNGAVRFFGTVLSNSQLVERNLSVTSVRGRVNGSQIQCTFLATIPDPLIKSTGFSLSVSTGTFNATAGTLGPPGTVIRTPVVDLANPNTTVVNQANTTPAPVTSGLPPFIILAGNLPTNISRTGCGSQKLCVAEPSVCDPSISDSCSFFSAKQQSGQTFDFELSGQTNGYVAAALSPDTILGNGNDIFYICAHVGDGLLAFASASFNNSQLSVTPGNVSSVNGSVSGNKTQCIFRTTVPDTATTKAAGFSVSVATGALNITSVTPGFPTIRITTNVIDLTNPNATFINLLTATNTTNTTAAPATTAHAVTHQQSLIPALLFTLAVLLFTMQGGN